MAGGCLSITLSATCGTPDDASPPPSTSKKFVASTVEQRRERAAIIPVIIIIIPAATTTTNFIFAKCHIEVNVCDQRTLVGRRSDEEVIGVSVAMPLAIAA
eukprot:CAMPEP_0185756336 /NCGR_PEP_ID=MMETSP1174-20130828/14761_1 /TAXON_ID=35687 /ORGANISM="Dictyocha speculum, Strain CCMP1381" /LENGTH=100 /DNA_ID=CAMNT_0028435245 /DNA_START=287 /DNA_END=588 /DNA_ORIENTATION=+